MLRKIGSLLLSSFLLILAFPNPQISILAWAALIPLFFLIDNSSRRIAFLLSYFCGLFFFAGLLYWLLYVTKLGYFVLIFYLALYFGLFGLFANLFLTKLRASKLAFLLFLILPALWVSLELIRGILFTGFPWGILGYTQYNNPILIQIADITGAYGVSFVIVMINFAIYASFLNIKRSTRHCYRALKPQVAVSIIVLAAVMLYGYFALNEDDVDTGLKLSVVQGNIEQEKKWDSYYTNFIFDRYETLTREAAKDKANLIIWPETSLPGFLGEEAIDLRLGRIIRDIDAPLFLGAATYEFHNGQERFYNSALLFSPEGGIKERYDKIHLVPLGEYVPFENHFPFVRNFVNKPIGDYAPGKEYTIFGIESKRGNLLNYAALICFEDIFPGLVRRFVAKGADFAVNITNDAWFGESSEQLQHAQASVFRAVENRIGIVRAGNTGFSCYINPNGMIEDWIYDEDTGSMYVASFKTFDLKIDERNTFYTKFGDIFAYLCILLVLGTLSYLVRRHFPIQLGKRL